MYSNLKFDFKTDTPDDFLVTLQRKARKPIRMQILRLSLQLIHMQRMRLLNKLGLTKTHRIAQKYALLKQHDQLKLGVSLSKICLDGYLQS